MLHPHAASMQACAGSGAWQARRSVARLLSPAQPLDAGLRRSGAALRWRCQGRGRGVRPAATATTQQTATSASSSSSSSKDSRGEESGGSSTDEEEEHEPEVALILVACGIGLATGAAIVLFNDVIHLIRDGIWQNGELLSSAKSLRNISESELWPKVVFPPVLGGALVGLLGWVMGGYNDPPKPPTPLAPAAAAPAALGAGSSAAGPKAGGGLLGKYGDPSGSMSTRSSDMSAVEEVGASLEQARSATRPIARAVAAAVTLGTGASLGPEGPSVDIGRSVAKALGSRLKSQEAHITRLLAAGSGAGVAAGFNAPIAGVFFAVETVLQRQRSSRPAGGKGGSKGSSGPNGLTVAMVLLAAVLAAVVSQAGLGNTPAFRVPEYRLESMVELPLFLAFGALCGTISASFSYSTRVAGKAFDEIRAENPAEGALMPMVGGLTTGVLALGYPEILYQGFDNVNTILFAGDYAPGLLIQIVVMKIIATSICRGSGLQGGIYAPSILIGAALGSAFGQLAHMVGDPAGLHLAAPQAYALVGVAAMLASNCQVPLTSVLLLFELTRDYLIILPTLAAVGISFWISSLAAPSVKDTSAATAALAAAIRRQQAEAMASGLGLGLGSELFGAGPVAGGLAARPAAEEESMLDGVSTDPKVAKETMAAVMHQLEEVLHLGEGVLQGRAKLGGGHAGEGEQAAAASAAGGAAEGGAAAAAAAAAEAAQLDPLGSLAAVVAAGGEPFPPLVLPVEMAPAEALGLMEREGRGVAVVVAGDGSVAGVVTLSLLSDCLRQHQQGQDQHQQEPAPNGVAANGAASREL